MNGVNNDPFNIGFIGTNLDDILRIDIFYPNVYAGAGDDTIISRVPTGTLIDGEDGFDTLVYRTNSNMFINLEQGYADIRARAPSGPLLDHGDGNFPDLLASVERIVVTSGNNIVIASEVGSTIFSRDGNDELRGGAGRDKIKAGDGDDHLSDGAGVDNLFGGAGADTFELIRDGDVDVIKDFNGDEDMLDLTGWGVFFFSQLEITTTSKRTIVQFEDEKLVMNLDAGLTTENTILSELVIA